MSRKTESLYIILVGCGKIGSIVASRLSAMGHNVVVIDRNEKAFERLSEEFTGFKIFGDGTEVSNLRETRIEHADVVIAATDDDNTNFMIAAIAKQYFGVPLVISLVNDPYNEEIFRQFEIQIISPTSLSAEGILNKITSEGRH
ncbi:potassium channel family protein [Pseudothermotoga thermarum]|uniref:TrkA-N domain protein n=1 Tax=Pseudothermotoga thermarum DSM 5069 TaxID=688269 RepID=F7YW20_9THEM|nr:TrkA family potassium uptake protein [Pseudothermotoga thermarum]AEH50507.1 TrkA-N domain protein [Pseudothermotoga thermarum DSM 5069]